jgi:hypothetical protein
MKRKMGDRERRRNMKRADVQHRHVKEDDNTHETSAEEAAPDASRARTQQGGGHRSGSSGAGTSEKLDREPERKGPSNAA